MNKNKKEHSQSESKSEIDEIIEDKAEETASEETEISPEDIIDDAGGDEDIVDSLKAENQKLKEDFLRAYADLENNKKRCAQEIEKNSKYAISSFGKELLSVADNLHRAIEAVPADGGHEDCEALRKGVELTENELVKVFKKFGIVKMDIMGKVFDPNYHQVVQEVEDKEKPHGTIIAELQTGYMINDRILREAMVVVTKGGQN